METLTDIAMGFWQTLGQMSPYLLLGFFVAGLLSVLISTAWVERHLGGRGGLSVVKAAAMGVPLPLCSCGVIPVSASLREKGAGRGATTSFLISTPQTGADSIFVTFSLLGPIYAIYRPVLALVSGILGGFGANLVERDQAPAQARQPGRKADKGQEDCRDEPATSCCAAPNVSRIGKIREMFTHGFVTLPRDIGKALLLGVAISALITALIPADFFAGALGTGLTGMAVMLLAAVPMYVCATASVPIAAALILKGASPGAALVFLMTGPATNAATIATVWKVMGHRTALVYLATMVVCAVGGGLLLDVILPAGQVIDYVPHGQMHLAWWQVAASLVLLAILIGATAGSWVAKRRGATDRVEPGPDNLAAASGTRTLQLAGLTCGHCVASVTESLLAVPGVDGADVDLDTGQARVTGRDLEVARLTEAVEGKGYQVVAAR